ncbi:type 4b pilus protein PilO2 [Herbaspirillum seropedicae]|uniref:type 4b pilus protein PilO2 n=1 Tax=Herbaspirillum seropedicae TaxID=964 RepID=UPI0028571EFB|nr:type 4b pilus protein PilO2 [Herbaspirillum seropedicae]MDR6398061.1 hypothetical protein [Herbaspirillum seropedicae]
MAAHIFESAGRQVVFGLEWFALTGTDSEQKEFRKKAIELDAHYKVRYAGPTVVAYGFAEKEGLTPGKKPMLSASVLLANMPNVAPNAVWIWVDGDFAYMAAISNGAPLNGGDYAGPAAKAQAFIEGFQRDVGSDTLVVYGNYMDVYQQTVPLELKELVERGAVDAAAISKVGLTINPKLLVLGALVLAIAGGGFGFKLYQDHERAARMKKRGPAKPALDVAKMYRESLARALSSAAAMSLPSSAAAKVFVGPWSKQEVLEGGWRLYRLDCMPTTCSYMWKVEGGNNETLTTALAARGVRKDQIEYSLAGNEARYTASLARATVLPLDIASLPGSQQFLLTAGAFFQDLRLIGGQVTLGQPTVFGAESALDTKLIKDVVRSGSISIEAPGALLEEILRRTPDNIMYGRMEYGLDNAQPKFKLQGNYYVKN